VVGLNGRTPPSAPAPLVTARVVQVPGRGPRLEPVVQVRFGQLGLWPRVVHSASSPSVAELLLVAGCLLVVFEFFTAGVGVAAAVAGTILVMVGGMPAVVRARFSTPTIGRESMVGEVGRALTDVSPEGTVELRSAPWRARTNRATPIRAGEPVRVVGIDGLLLEVEPEGSTHGDHRQRRG